MKINTKLWWKPVCKFQGQPDLKKREKSKCHPWNSRQGYCFVNSVTQLYHTLQCCVTETKLSCFVLT